jgi:hypothetical protein
MPTPEQEEAEWQLPSPTPSAATRSSAALRRDRRGPRPLHVYIGDRLGLYGRSPIRPPDPGGLAAAAGIHARYAREWLEQQAASSILEVDDAAAEPSARRYALPDAHRKCSSTS